MVDVNILSGIGLFEDLGPDSLKNLAEFIEEKRYYEGDTIFKQGDSGNELYILKEGECEVQVDIGTDRKLSVQMMEPGTIFGELSFIDGKERTGTVICKKDAKVLILKREDFNKFMQKDKEGGAKLAMKIAYMVAEKLRETDKKFREYYLKATISMLKGIGVL